MEPRESRQLWLNFGEYSLTLGDANSVAQALMLLRSGVSGLPVRGVTGVTVVLQWCYNGFAMVSQWCYSVVTVVLQWCYSRATAML
jgi:hypothetical protein